MSRASAMSRCDCACASAITLWRCDSMLARAALIFSVLARPVAICCRRASSMRSTGLYASQYSAAQTMAKLTNCAAKWGQSTPNVAAILSTGPPPASCCSIKASTRPSPSLHEEQGVEHDGFRESNGQNRLHEDRCGCAWISSNCLGRFHSDEPHGQGGAQNRKRDVKV